MRKIIEDFDIEGYKNELGRQKQNLYEKIIYGLKHARDSYKVLAQEKIEVKNSEHEIFASLKSDVFEEFYPYLDMKTKFKRGNFNVSKTDLAQTRWINRAISESFSAG